MSFSNRSTIDRLIAVFEKRNELLPFLSTEKGFQREQYYRDCLVIHYVAGRQFETAEESDELLKYALLQTKQDIEQLSRVLQLRPLHCACEWGNNFGVEWLVRNGASVRVMEAKNGCTPYHFACASSVERMTKMVYLEEHGYVLSENDILGASSIQFSSLEEADEVFHHLVNEKELSVNSFNKSGENPLHRACLHGTFFGAKSLVEHGAALNSINYRGETSFMFACKSSIDRSLKVCYLDEVGADCLAEDRTRQACLFYATWSSTCEDDVKDVLHYLVIDKELDINSVNEEGRTPLLQACDLQPSLVLIQQLIELEADVCAKDNRKHNALHVAAKRCPMPIIELLIEKGVDVLCQDENGKTPYQIAQNGKIRALLRQHYDAARFAALQRELVRPDSIKLCVFGPERAGKTTLVNSLLQLGLPLPKEEDRTPGVEIHNQEIEGVGKVSTWDFGSQPTFHSAHGLFFRKSNTMFFLVLPLRGETSSEE